MNLLRLSSPEYEIIIDYKGMRRPASRASQGIEKFRMPWFQHMWQILTYAWLRSQQSQARQVVAGIVFYLNELVPSKQDMEQLSDDVRDELTDIMPPGLDQKELINWRPSTPSPELSGPFRNKRSIRIIRIDEDRINDSLRSFDKVVSDIEDSVANEMRGSEILNCWQVNPEERTCTACDFKTYCPNPAPRTSRNRSESPVPGGLPEPEGRPARERGKHPDYTGGPAHASKDPHDGT